VLTAGKNINTSAAMTAARRTVRIGAIRKNRKLASVKTSLSELPSASHEIGSITRERVHHAEQHR
jgi:hypothetical protein